VTDARNARTAVRVLERSGPSGVRVARQAVRVLVRPDPLGLRVARQSIRAAIQGPGDARITRQVVRVGITGTPGDVWVARVVTRVAYGQLSASAAFYFVAAAQNTQTGSGTTSMRFTPGATGFKLYPDGASAAVFFYGQAKTLVNYHSSGSARITFLAKAKIHFLTEGFAVEILPNPFGGWIDVTCDLRSIDVDRGRSTYLDAFAAASLTLVFANFDGAYSPFNPAGLWSADPRFSTGIPVRVRALTSGSTTLVLFTGTTDSVADEWPNIVDAMATVQATDGMKLLARKTNLPLPKNADGTDQLVGAYEFAGTRINRFADDAGWTGPRSIEAGLVHLTGTDMAGTAIDNMRQVGEAEWGWLFIDQDGTLVFYQRDIVLRRTRMTTVQWTFADVDDPLHPDWICYRDPVVMTDESKIVNDANIQVPSTLPGQPPFPDAPATPKVSTRNVEAGDAASAAHYGPRSWTRTDLPLVFADEARGTAQTVVTWYAYDDKRIERLTFSALDGAYARVAATQVQIGDRIRFIRHYPGGFLLDTELLVQGMHHTVTPAGDAELMPQAWDVELSLERAINLTGACKWDSGQWDRCRWTI
jgi:hypothetical protein